MFAHQGFQIATRPFNTAGVASVWVGQPLQSSGLSPQQPQQDLSTPQGLQASGLGSSCKRLVWAAVASG